MLLVDDLAAGVTKNLRHTPRGLVTLGLWFYKYLDVSSIVYYFAFSTMIVMISMGRFQISWSIIISNFWKIGVRYCFCFLFF